MKFFAVLAAFALASVSAYNEVDDCPVSEIIKLRELIEYPARPICEQQSGYQIVPPLGDPTDSQLALMCISTECVDTLKKLLSLEPADCMTNFGVSRLNVKKLAESFKPRCHDLGIDV